VIYFGRISQAQATEFSEVNRRQNPPRGSVNHFEPPQAEVSNYCEFTAVLKNRHGTRRNTEYTGCKVTTKLAARGIKHPAILSVFICDGNTQQAPAVKFTESAVIMCEAPGPEGDNRASEKTPRSGVFYC
jgi:hypothetical protein